MRDQVVLGEEMELLIGVYLLAQLQLFALAGEPDDLYLAAS